MDHNSLRDGDLVTLKAAPIGYRDKLVRVKRDENGVTLEPVPTKERRLIEAANEILKKYSKFE